MNEEKAKESNQVNREDQLRHAILMWRWGYLPEPSPFDFGVAEGCPSKNAYHRIHRVTESYEDFWATAQPISQ